LGRLRFFASTVLKQIVAPHTSMPTHIGGLRLSTKRWLSFSTSFGAYGVSFVVAIVAAPWARHRSVAWFVNIVGLVSLANVARVAVLSSPVPFELSLRELGMLLAAPGVESDILAGLNAAELGRRQFREIARIAGLVFQGYPGQPQSNRQLQASSGLLWDVFNEYDPDNLLLRQSTREVLQRRDECAWAVHQREDERCLVRPGPASNGGLRAGLGDHQESREVGGVVLQMLGEQCRAVQLGGSPAGDRCLAARCSLTKRLRTPQSALADILRHLKWRGRTARSPTEQ